MSDPVSVPHGSTTKSSPTGLGSKIRLKKDDIRQCRLCLRMLPGKDFSPWNNDESEVADFRRQICDAVGVRINDDDRIQAVCSSCSLLVDMVNSFRESCLKADIIHQSKQLVMHPCPSCTSEDSKGILEDCHRLVKRSWDEMDGMFKVFECKNRETERRLERKAIRNVPPVINPLPGALFDGDDDEVLDETLLESIPFTHPSHSGSKAAKTTKIEITFSERSNHCESFPSPKPRSEVPVQKKAICDVCGKFTESHLMEQHRNKHLGIRPYVCTQEGCGKGYFSRRVLAAHIRVVHLDDPLECPVCQRKLKGKALLRRHMLVHNEGQQKNPRKSACQVCGKMFYKFYLKDHMAVHTGILAYPCGICDRRFAAMNNRLTHWKKVHPDVEHILGKTPQDSGSLNDD